MAYNDDQLSRIFDRTDERCHLCGGTLSFENYSNFWHPEGWEVDHDIPKANGGSDDESNLLPAHASCNRSKQTTSSALVRAANRLVARPWSAEERWDGRWDAAVVGGAAGALAGGVAGAVSASPEEDRVERAVKWAFIGGVLIAALGFVLDPEGP